MATSLASIRCGATAPLAAGIALPAAQPLEHQVGDLGAIGRAQQPAAARADLLERLDRRAEAGREFQRAAELAGNARPRARLLARAAAGATTDDAA